MNRQLEIWVILNILNTLNTLYKYVVSRHFD